MQWSAYFFQFESNDGTSIHPEEVQEVGFAPTMTYGKVAQPAQKLLGD